MPAADAEESNMSKQPVEKIVRDFVRSKRAPSSDGEVYAKIIERLKPPAPQPRPRRPGA
jgi:hypothetical protein